MGALPQKSCWMFVVQTDSYAGNFEREMCGYVAGGLGECDVGDEQAAEYMAAFPDESEDELWDRFVRVPDEHGCARPVSLWGPEAQDVAIFLAERPTDELLARFRVRARVFAAGHTTCGIPDSVEILGFKLVRYIVVRKESVDEEWSPTS